MAKNSATEREYQTPSTPKNIGNINTVAIWKTRVRKKEIAADTAPLLSPVKNDEAKMQNPEKKKEREKIFSPPDVILSNTGS